MWQIMSGEIQHNDGDSLLIIKTPFGWMVEAVTHITVQTDSKCAARVLHDQSEETTLKNQYFYTKIRDVFYGPKFTRRRGRKLSPVCKETEKNLTTGEGRYYFTLPWKLQK